MSLTTTLQQDFQKVPILFKEMGQLAPDNLDGYLKIEVPVFAIGDLLEKIKEEHESNKEKHDEFASSIKKCLDKCKPYNRKYRCLVDKYWETYEPCKRYEDKNLIKMEAMKIDKLEHKYGAMKKILSHKSESAHYSRGVTLNNKEKKHQRRKRVVALIIMGIIGLGCALAAGYNLYRTQKLADRTATLHENDFLIAGGLDTVFKHAEETNQNINYLKNATNEIVLEQEGQARKLQLLESDITRESHFQFNYDTCQDAISVTKDIMESMFTGHLSPRIEEIHDLQGGFKDFLEKASQKKYTAAIQEYSQLFHMKTIYFIDQQSLTIHLCVNIPFVRNVEVMKMVEYKPSQIPTSENFGINIVGHDDILAFNSKHYVTFKSSNLWKCDRISTIFFCDDVVDYLKPISQLGTSCLGSLWNKNSDGIMEKCDEKNLKPLALDIKKIKSNQFVIFSIKRDMVTFRCENEKLSYQTIEPKVYTKVTVKDGCIGELYSGNELIPDEDYESEEIYTSFNLHFETNYVQKISGMDDEKVHEVMKYLNKINQSIPISEVHQVSQIIEKEKKMTSKLDGIFDDLMGTFNIFGGLGIGSSVLVVCVAGLAVYFFCIKGHRDRIEHLEFLNGVRH